MATLAQTLKNQFVFVNLGAAVDKDHDLPADICRSFTVVEIDAVTPSHTASNYFKRHAIKGIVAGSKGRKQLRINRNPLTSSLLTPNEALIAQYGIESDFTQVALEDVDCITVPDILAENGIKAIDLLKTDIEGIDYEVLRSMGPLLRDVIAIQCELRFQPFFHGEPYFHEVVSYLNGWDFEVIGLDVEYWKPKTSNRRRHIDGRITNCDVVLFKKAEAIRAMPADRRPIIWAKQIVLACMLGKKCYAEFILESCQNELPSEWLPELKAMVKPKLRTFVARSLIMLARYILRFSVRQHSHQHIIKGCRDEFYLGGSNRRMW